MSVRVGKCTFCLKDYKDDDLNVFHSTKICNSCIEDLWKAQNHKLEAQRLTDQEKSKNSTETLRPKDIKARIDEFVIGQHKAKKILSVAVYNHLKRLRLNDINIQKSNILLLGPTGSGKTCLVRNLAKILNVPLVITPATTLTEEGYIGESVSSIIEKLFMASGRDVKKAEQGIVFIDEIDKLARTSKTNQRDVGGTGVQQALLPILEGTKIIIGDKHGMFNDAVEIDTTNILFICGGAFADAERIIKERLIKVSDELTSNNSENAYLNDTNLLLQVTNDDLLAFGLIPEFIGRLPIIAPLEALTTESLRKILTDPKDSIVSQYQKLFECDGVKLTFEDNALEEIANKAIILGTGARSLRSILEDILLDLMYETPSDLQVSKIIITKSFITGTGSPGYISR